jgi:hypothetical protein
MQVSRIVVARIAVDMVDDLAGLGSCDLPMLPFASGPLGTVPQALRALGQPGMSPVRLLGHNARRISSRCHRRNRAHHPIAAPQVRSVWHPGNLSLVGVERVAVAAEHLVVPVAQVAGNRGPVAMQAWAAHDLSAPSVLRRAMPLHSLVVHEAQAVCGMFSTASLNRASPHSRVFAHAPLYSLGNSMAVNCMAWIGERIALMEEAS